MLLWWCILGIISYIQDVIVRQYFVHNFLYSSILLYYCILYIISYILECYCNSLSCTMYIISYILGSYCTTVSCTHRFSTRRTDADAEQGIRSKIFLSYFDQLLQEINKQNKNIYKWIFAWKISSVRKSEFVTKTQILAG